MGYITLNPNQGITPPHFTLSRVPYPPDPHNPLRWPEGARPMIEGEVISFILLPSSLPLHVFSFIFVVPATTLL